MTSRFVSGGVIAGDDPDAGAAAPPAANTAGGGGESGGGREDGDKKKNALAAEWETVQKDLEEERRRREEARRGAVEGGGERSLYEILQANKAAKQAAFEEQNRIRNQFRALDDDEIEFLHGVNDERRAEEARVRRETEERLAGFRKKQRAVGGVNHDAPDAGDEVGIDEEWGHAASGRKRKREREKDRGVLKGVKRRTSTGAREKEGDGGDAPSSAATGEQAKLAAAGSVPSAEAAVVVPATAAVTTEQVKPKPKPALGLVDYGSDEDDD